MRNIKILMVCLGNICRSPLAQGILQSKNIGAYFKNNNIRFSEVISSEWCRCKETALIAFKNYQTENFLNSFYSAKFAKNRKMQMGGKLGQCN